MALGGQSRITSVGELVALDRWISDGRQCSCGCLLNECPRWSSVITEPNRRVNVPVMPFVRHPYLTKNYAQRMQSDLYYESIIQRNLDLYRTISNVTGNDYIVDSSKSPLHFYYLRKSGYFRIVPIYLVRRGEEYIDSALRRGIPRRTAIKRWIQKNIQSIQVLRESGLFKSALHVRYDDFIQEPSEVLEKICNYCNLNYESNMLQFYQQSHHNVAGTRTRFNPRPIEPVKKNNSLKVFDRALFQLCGGFLWNKLFDA